MRSIQNTNRTTWLPVLLFFLILAATAAMLGQDSTEPPFALKQAGPDVWVAIGRPQGQSNAGFVIGDDGVAIIDTPPGVDANGTLSGDPAKQLLTEIRKRTTLPLKFVIN